MKHSLLFVSLALIALLVFIAYFFITIGLHMLNTFGIFDIRALLTIILLFWSYASILKVLWNQGTKNN